MITPSFCDTAETYFPVSAVSVLSSLLIAFLISAVILFITFVLVSKSESFVSCDTFFGISVFFAYGVRSISVVPIFSYRAAVLPSAGRKMYSSSLF